MKIKKLFYIICLIPILAIAKPTNTITLNPLNMQVRLDIPNTTITLGQAVLYIIAPTDYQLAIGYPASKDSPYIAMRPVPPEAFSGRVMSVADAILLFIGPENRLLIDPIHKLVSFERDPNYHKHRKYQRGNYD